MNKFEAKQSQLETQLTELREQYTASVEVEQNLLTKGESYTIQTGAPSALVDEVGVFLGEVEENGKVRLVFRVGEDVHQRIVRTVSNRVILPIPEGHVPSANIAKRIAMTEARLARLPEEIAAAATARTFVEGEEVQLLVGRADQRRYAEAVVQEINTYVDEHGDEVRQYLLRCEDRLVLSNGGNIRKAQAAVEQTAAEA